LKTKLFYSNYFYAIEYSYPAAYIKVLNEKKVLKLFKLTGILVRKKTYKVCLKLPFKVQDTSSSISDQNVFMLCGTNTSKQLILLFARGKTQPGTDLRRD
jgi:hypothetical protein